MPKLAYDMSPSDQRAAIAYAEKRWGIHFPGAQAFLRPEFKHNLDLAMDAQPQLVTTPSSGIPAFLSFFLDPDLLRVLTAKLEAAEIFGEQQKGDWLSSTLIFPVIERTYEVSSYGDYNENGSAGINATFPERQPYIFQTEARYGTFEMERLGLAKINFVSEQKEAAIYGLNQFQNLSYFKGIAGLSNYGCLNDPNLYPAIAPSPKAFGGLNWTSNGQVVATANEVFNDIQSLVYQAIKQSSGQLNLKSKYVLAMSPTTEVGLTATNSFNVNVAALLEKNFPNLEVKTAVQYGALSTQNPQGSAVGEVVQLWAPEAAGQNSGYMAFNMKLRAFPIIVGSSSYKQKMAMGTAGFVLRQPWAMATMVGV